MKRFTIRSAGVHELRRFWAPLSTVPESRHLAMPKMSAPAVMGKEEMQTRIGQLTHLIGLTEAIGSNITKTQRRKMVTRMEERTALQDAVARGSYSQSLPLGAAIPTPGQVGGSLNPRFQKVSGSSSYQAPMNFYSGDSPRIPLSSPSNYTGQIPASRVGNQYAQPYQQPPLKVPQSTRGPAMAQSHIAQMNFAPPSAKSAGDRRDPIVPPSIESGGVPEPRDYYLAGSLVPSLTALTLQPILIVIDLNGTILHRPKRSQSSNFIERPFTPHFMHYVLCNFKVVIWSSARPENVNKMVHKLLPGEQRTQLVAVWGRDRMGLSMADYSKRVQVYKRLERVWDDENIQLSHSHQRRWDQTNTILIDDSFEKARSEPYNLIPVPEFDGSPEDPNILRKLAEYLDLVKMQTNVSAFIRQNPFRLGDIQPNEDGNVVNSRVAKQLA